MSDISIVDLRKAMAELICQRPQHFDSVVWNGDELVCTQCLDRGSYHVDVLEEHMKQAKDLGSRPKKMSKLRYADVPTGFPLIYTATTLNTGGTGIITTTPVREEREMLENTWNQPAPLMEAFELRNQQVGPYIDYRVEDVTLDGFEDTDIRQNMRLDVERLVNDGVLHANRGDQVTYNGIRYNVV